MSSIKLSPNASGTGEFTIAAPNSNTNRTLTLPDQTGTVLTNAGPFTANASASAGAVTIDASNNVGIGTGSPGTRLDVQQATTNVLAQFRNTSSSNQNGNVSAVNDSGTALRIQVFGSAAGSYGMLSAGSPVIYTSASELNFAADNASGVIKFSTGSSVPERVRIDSSGNLLVGGTSGDPNPGVFIYKSGAVSQGNSAGGSGFEFASFRRSGTQIGTITQNGTTAVAYNTTSDYRLKENVQPLTGALARVAALKPVTYTWKSAPDEIGEGFIAHELAEVCPQAVTGEKDAVNEDGSIKAQSIDTSFLVATLTAAIQEQQALIESLTARIAALEAQP